LINLDFADVKAVMSNAGSALMGIGRASGENRAVAAAQQAVESPLLEVSIDGARGILFNVIGGSDMSMHEINTAAETITAAADPDANIIFGATINPELEGEIIITVVATGFDASYFGRRALPTNPLLADEPDERPVTSTPKTEESIMQDMDMELSDNKVESNDFTDEKPLPNIWTIDSDESSDDKKEEKTESSDVSSVVTDEEEELEKPSFLRRLTKKRNQDKKKDQEPGK
jgi:cell division protein FtsZ